MPITPTSRREFRQQERPEDTEETILEATARVLGTGFLNADGALRQDRRLSSIQHQVRR